MENYLPVLKKSNLFIGMEETEIEAMLRCLSARTQTFGRNETILRSGEQISSVGMVLSGLALIEKEDFWGNRSIISEISPGMIFAEAYACLSQVPIETNVIASEDTAVMFLNVKKILTVCTSACSFHSRLIQNLLTTIARKNITLTKKIQHISLKTIRDKLLSYLSTESLKAGKAVFEIPFNRQQLADYLSVDRSALSSEISKLQREGILSCNKNKFEILYHEASYSTRPGAV